uniref:Uncharacterized protein n=1 Tax=Avena sativa TaxID=4498 RepID=A0ACD5YGW8_AVESA
MEIDYLGKVNILTWENSTSVWKVLYTPPEHVCNTYNYCGPYGYCDNTEIVPVCKCFHGFKPRDDKGWISGRFSQGCLRKEMLRCTHGDGFSTLTGMKVPDKFLHIPGRSFGECAEECVNNCSCAAYAYSRMSNMYIDGYETRCLVWMGDLIDMENSTHGGENLFVRTNIVRGSKRMINPLKIMLPTISGLLMLICMWLIWICGCRGSQGSKNTWRRMTLGDTGSFNELADRDTKFPILSFREIASATNNFSESGILGKGGFGNVYKGMLVDGTEIAVKRLRAGSSQGVLEFKNEIDLPAKLQHRNLVKLIGCCIHKDENILIYEYLPNKSLDAFIFSRFQSFLASNQLFVKQICITNKILLVILPLIDDTRKSLLNWPIRFQIIRGVARGLLYLHQDSRLMMIHRDLKPSNVLLDAEMIPKISDFGTARIFGANEKQEYTSRVVGTL